MQFTVSVRVTGPSFLGGGRGVPSYVEALSRGAASSKISVP